MDDGSKIIFDLTEEQTEHAIQDFEGLIDRLKAYCRHNMEQDKAVFFSYCDLKAKLESLAYTSSIIRLYDSYGYIRGFIAALLGIDFITRNEKESLLAELSDRFQYGMKNCGLFPAV